MQVGREFGLTKERVDPRCSADSGALEFDSIL